MLLYYFYLPILVLVLRPCVYVVVRLVLVVALLLLLFESLPPTVAVLSRKILLRLLDDLLVRLFRERCLHLEHPADVHVEGLERRQCRHSVLRVLREVVLVKAVDYYVFYLVGFNAGILESFLVAVKSGTAIRTYYL